MDAEPLEIRSLAKKKRCVDLALDACRKRQSPRTGFVHYFPFDEGQTDVIPLYENFCFAAALYRQKTVEAALEGKELLERLLAFQTPEGNFPLYLHEFPRCKDRMQGLKIASILVQLQRHFSSVLPPSLKEGLRSCVEKIFSHAGERKNGLVELDPVHFSAADWAQWLLSSQLSEAPLAVNVPSPFHPKMQLFLLSEAPQIQEGFEPKVQLLEWILAESSAAFSPRLLKDHPLQMQLAAIWKAPYFQERSQGFQENYAAVLGSKVDLLRIFWSSEKLNSFVAPQPGYGRICQIGENQWEILFDLPEDADQSHNDLFEALFYCNASSDVELSINDQKGMVFYLGDSVRIRTGGFELSLSAELVSGSGDFCGHLSLANRPSQIDKKHYKTYDWQIGIRTLRRTARATLRVVILRTVI